MLLTTGLLRCGEQITLLSSFSNVSTDFWHHLILREPILGNTDVTRSVPVKVQGSEPNQTVNASIYFWKSKMHTSSILEWNHTWIFYFFLFWVTFINNCCCFGLGWLITITDLGSRLSKLFIYHYWPQTTSFAPSFFGVKIKVKREESSSETYLHLIESVHSVN